MEDFITIFNHFRDSSKIGIVARFTQTFHASDIYAELFEFHKKAYMKRMAISFCDISVRLVIDRSLWMLVRIWQSISRVNDLTIKDKVEMLLIPFVGRVLAASVCEGVTEDGPNYMRIYSNKEMKFAGFLSALASMSTLIIRENSTIKEMLNVVKQFVNSVAHVMDEVSGVMGIENEFINQSPLLRRL
jgi:predicted DNA-binding ArsR family transcriptional regulator